MSCTSLEFPITRCRDSQSGRAQSVRCLIYLICSSRVLDAGRRLGTARCRHSNRSVIAYSSCDGHERKIMQAESTAQLLGEIQSLSDLHSQLQSLRHIPRILLKLPAFASLVPPSTPTLRSQFQQLNEIAQILRSHPVQHALRSAHDSFVNDTSELAPSLRRDDRKRRFVDSLSPLQSNHHLQARARSRIPPTILPSGAKEISRVPSR